MNITEILAAIRFRLGNKKGFDNDILREINYAQQRLEDDPTIDYWFLVRFGAFSLTAGDNIVTIPSDFVREYDGYPPYLTLNERVVHLDKMDLPDAQIVYGDSTGVPEAYTVVDGEVKVYPKPDQNYVLTFPYVGRETTLDGVSVLENGWTKNATQVLLNKAGIALAQAFRDQDALANFTADYQVAFSELMTRVVAREEANMARERGGRTDAFRKYY
jgi:hypothetical protein